MVFQVLILLLLSSCTFGEKNDECKINIFAKFSNRPFIFTKEDPGYFEFARPQFVKKKQADVHIEEGKEVVFSCGSSKFKTEALSSQSSVKAKCSGNNKFTVQDQEYGFSKFACRRKATSDLIITSEACADDKGVIVDIGVNVTLKTTVFRKTLMEVCFNTKESVSYYSEHMILGSALNGSDAEGDRPSFRVGDSSLYNFSPDESYKKTTQESTLTYLLDSKELAEDILKATYFARGHLAPDADFVTQETRDATYYYINAAPQWQSFNAGTWLGVEKAVRNLAKSTTLDYLIVTGTYAVLTLNDINNNDVDIYLHGAEGENPKLPAPKFYWKIMYDSDSRLGIAFVGLNSHVTQKVTWPCKDVCSATNWGTASWNSSIICCAVPDFQKKVTSYPKLSVSGLLNGVA